MNCLLRQVIVSDRKLNIRSEPWRLLLPEALQPTRGLLPPGQEARDRGGHYPVRYSRRRNLRPNSGEALHPNP